MLDFPQIDPAVGMWFFIWLGVLLVLVGVVYGVKLAAKLWGWK